MFNLYILIPSLTLLITIPVIFLLAPTILPIHQITISVSDELDDLSLFHKAIVADSTFHKKKLSHNNNNKLPSNKFHLGSTSIRRPKIAFLFLTNSNLHFAPLWNQFFNTSDPHLYNIYIHADPTVKITPPLGVFTHRFIHAKKTQRSSPTLISATRRLLAHALLDDPDNIYFSLISQSCIPLHSFNYFYNFLLNTQKLSNKMELPSYIEVLEKFPFLLQRYNARGKNVMLPEVSYNQFQVGSQFFVITRKHALIVIKDTKLWRKFKKGCIKIESCYPEEHYFPTLLAMEDVNGVTRFTLTNVNWTNSVDGHPRSYGVGEVKPELIYKLRESNLSTYEYMFARKFSPDCLKPLMDMADSVIFKD